MPGNVEATLLDLGELVTSSPIDGIHLEAQEHREIGTSATPRDATFSGRSREMRCPTSSEVKHQSRQARAASVAIPSWARAGVTDQPSSTSSTPPTS